MAAPEIFLLRRGGAVHHAPKPVARSRVSRDR